MKKLILTALTGALLGLGLSGVAACNVAFTTADSSGGASGTPPDINMGDAGSSDDASADSAAPPNGDAGASAYQGSPLCNWSTSRSACNPDETLACSPVTDAGVAPSDAGVAAPTEACHVSVAVQNGQSVTGQECKAAGTGKDGEACQRGTDCAAGFECVGAGICRHYCCDYRECDVAGKTLFCDVQTLTSGSSLDTRVPVCMPIMSCKLLLPGYCSQGETCAPVRTDGTTSCVAVGAAKVGEPCDREHCDKDLACLGAPGNRSCYQLCHTDSTSECPPTKKCKTSSAEFLDPTIGVCE